MDTMNNTCPQKTCPYCTGLHGELFRLRNKPAESKIDTSDPPVAFAKAFCLARGRVAEVETKEYAKLVDAIGSSKANSVYCLCWALIWGQTTGNTINGARNKLLSLSIGSFSSLELFVLAWHGPLFIAIGILNAILKRIPGSFPSIFSVAMGVILWIPQAVFVAPIGLASFVRHGLKVV